MRKIILGLLLGGLITGCQSNTKKTNVENFREFHQKFYSDSVFQVSRIVFPLPGADSDVIYGDEVVENQENDKYLIDNNKLYWKRTGWKFIEAPAESSEFIISVEKVDSFMKEQISSKETDLVITLQFSLIDDKWMLTYYSHEWY